MTDIDTIERINIEIRNSQFVCIFILCYEFLSRTFSPK